MFEDVTPNIAAGARVIDSYGPGRFTVAGRLYQGSILVSAEDVRLWPPRHFAEISVDSFSALSGLQASIDILLIGCGEKSRFLKANIRTFLKEQGLIVDFMATGAAARTYNIMLSEGRKVAAALIALPAPDPIV